MAYAQSSEVSLDDGGEGARAVVPELVVACTEELVEHDARDVDGGLRAAGRGKVPERSSEVAGARADAVEEELASMPVQGDEVEGDMEPADGVLEERAAFGVGARVVTPTLLGERLRGVARVAFAEEGVACVAREDGEVAPGIADIVLDEEALAEGALGVLEGLEGYAAKVAHEGLEGAGEAELGVELGEPEARAAVLGARVLASARGGAHERVLVDAAAGVVSAACGARAGLVRTQRDGGREARERDGDRRIAQEREPRGEEVGEVDEGRERGLEGEKAALHGRLPLIYYSRK
jgi:hypothetical protein